LEAHPGGGAGAVMRPVSSVFKDLLRVDDGNDSSPNGWTGRNALGVPGRAQYTKV